MTRASDPQTEVKSGLSIICAESVDFRFTSRSLRSVPFKSAEEKRTYNKAYREKNAEAIRAYQRDWLRAQKLKDPSVRARYSERAAKWAVDNPQRQREIVARSEAKNRARNERSRRNAKLKGSHGITIARYEQLLESQKGVCAICAAPEAGVRGRKNLFVDHDHETGTIRGLLCNDCNLGLARFKDQPALLQNAVAYLGVCRGQ